jgi:hypothetical protein
MSREDIIRHIVHREAQAQCLSEAKVLDDAPELHNAACAQFGTWETALQYAGVPMRRSCPQPGVSREQVIREILYLCRCAGRLHAGRIKRRHRQLYDSAKAHFGTWRLALQAAGINLRNALLSSKRRRLDKQRIGKEIQKRRQAGQSLRWKDVCREDRNLAMAANHAFRSWRKAVLAAGIDAVTNSTATRWNQQRIVAAIQLRAQRNLPLNTSAVDRGDSPLCCAARRYFGSWRNAMQAAGLDLANYQLRRGHQ